MQQRRDRRGQKPRGFSRGGNVPGGMKQKKRTCVFCAEKVAHLDYKDINRVRKFVNDRGKIIPKRISGNCSKHQRQMTIAIKRARGMAIL